MARALRSEINVTPLVDIVLVLLIVFIIVTPAVDSAVKLPIAKHARKETGELGPKISLRREGRYARACLEVQGRPSAIYSIGGNSEAASLSAAIARLDKGDRESVVQVKADSGLPNELVGELLKACRAGGATRAIFITGQDAGPATGRI